MQKWDVMDIKLKMDYMGCVDYMHLYCIFCPAVYKYLLYRNITITYRCIKMQKSNNDNRDDIIMKNVVYILGVFSFCVIL